MIISDNEAVDLVPLPTKMEVMFLLRCVSVIRIIQKLINRFLRSLLSMITIRVSLFGFILLALSRIHTSTRPLTTIVYMLW